MENMEIQVQVDGRQATDKMVKKGKYDYINPDINSCHFPAVKRKDGEIKIHLVHFDRWISFEEALQELEKMGRRPAELTELLAVGAQHPDLQREFPIIALGSTWRESDEDCWAPCLGGGADERSLYLTLIQYARTPNYRFAAV